MKLTDEEYAELQSYFSSYLNYESGKNLNDPIDPFTYRDFFDSSTALHELASRVNRVNIPTLFLLEISNPIFQSQ